ELQNIADFAVLGALIRADKLDQHAGWDMSRMLAVVGWPVAKYPIPQTAETLVAFTSGSICAGGVSFDCGPVVDKDARKADAKKQLEPAKEQAQKSRGTGAIV